MLGRGWTRLSRSGGVGDRGAVADRPHMRLALRARRRQRAVGHSHRRIHHHPPLPIERQAEAGDDRAGLDPGRPHDRPCRDRLAVGEDRSARGELAQGGVGAHLDPPPAQLAFGELGQALGNLLHDPRPALGQDPAHPLRAAAGIQLDGLRGEVLQLGQPLHSGVAGADEHEPQVLGAQRRVLQRTRRCPGSSAPGCAGRWRPTGTSARSHARPGRGSAASETRIRARRRAGHSRDRGARRRSGRTPSVRRAGSAPVTCPITSSVRRSCDRSGTTTWRGSSVAPAAPGSSGV